MDKRNWMEISKSLIERYKICSLYSTIKSLPLEIFYTAVSSFSGPIALLLDKNINHQFILPQVFNNSIIILNCKGELMKTISYSYKDKIIFMGFTKIQQLLIIQASGDYHLIDAFSGQIIQGNYSLASQKNEKYRGCQLMPSNNLILLREKQLGITDTLTSNWEALPDLKIKVQNPLFCTVFNSNEEFIYLTRQHAIEIYNIQSKRKTVIYSDSYLNQNWQNLLGMSFYKQKNILGLVYSKPSTIFYVDLLTNNHKRLDAMIELKYDLTCSNTPGLTNKYISRSFYKSADYTLGWLLGKFSLDEDLEELENSILVFANPKLLVMYDGKSTWMCPRSNCNQLISVQMDCIRVYTEDSHQIYRIVPYLFQTIIQINQINEGYYIDRFRKVIQLHDQYTNYLQKDIVDLSKFDILWKMVQQQSIKLQPDSELQNRDQNAGDDQIFSIIIENTPQKKQRIQQIETSIIKPLIRAIRYCIDPVDQVKMMKFIFFVKNLYNCPIDIYELCYQMRIINNLKFQFLSRTLTVNQFQYLKYEAKDRFLTILLRYRMHFIGDTIFKDSDSKYKIFLHWAKCKIQKSSQVMSFEEIKQKFQSIPKKNKNSRVFTDIAKYSLDRGKIGLAEKIIQLDENPQRKIMVYLLMMASISDKKLVQKLINAAEECTRSFLIFRVIRELMDATWIQNHAWVNILYQKPNVSRHYLRYLKAYGKEEHIKNYYFQNKDYENLGMYGVERMFQLGKGEEIQIPKYSEQALTNFIPKLEQLKKFLPNLYSVTKSYSKSNEMDLLRKVKATDYIPTEEELKQIKNDTVLEYIGQILYQKQKIDVSVAALTKIKSDKVYNILMRKERFTSAIELAAERKNKQALLQIKKKCPHELQDFVDEKIKSLSKS